jgi:molybdopterin converting factor small subunit
VVKATVKLIGPFIQAAGWSERVLEVPEGTTAEGLVEMIKLDRSRPRIVTRNGAAIGPDEPVRDGDRVVISPIYSGG